MSEQNESWQEWKEIAELEARRIELADDVARGDRNAIAEDRRLERRLRDVSRWIMRAEQEEEDERRAETERRGEQLREAWRQHHPTKEREKR